MSNPALERMLRVTALYDLYGGLLTDRQREFLELHYMRDLSLAEISEQHGVSRQSVHDTLARAESSLEWAESSLRLLQRLDSARGAMDKAAARCRELGLLLRIPEQVSRQDIQVAGETVERLAEDLDKAADLLRLGPVGKDD